MSPPFPLTKLALLDGLTVSECENFAALLELQQFQAEEFILRTSEQSGKIFFVQKGLVRVCLPQEAPHESDESQPAGLLLTIDGPGAMLGEISLLRGINHTADVVAIVPTQCWKIEGAAFKQFALETPRIAWNLAAIVAGHACRHNQHATTLCSRDAVAAIAHILLPLAEAHGTPYKTGGILLPVPFTQEKWVTATGFSRRTIYKALKILRDNLIIHEISGHRIVVTSLERLRRASRGIRLHDN